MGIMKIKMTRRRKDIDIKKKFNLTNKNQLFTNYREGD